MTNKFVPILKTTLKFLEPILPTTIMVFAGTSCARYLYTGNVYQFITTVGLFLAGAALSLTYFPRHPAAKLAVNSVGAIGMLWFGILKAYMTLQSEQYTYAVLYALCAGIMAVCLYDVNARLFSAESSHNE